ncbi:hypothetical protein Tco_1470213, partial [Tanacetum coccineum]
MMSPTSSLPLFMKCIVGDLHGGNSKAVGAYFSEDSSSH